MKYKVSESMSFEDRNLSSNPEILSFSSHHFTHSKKKGDVNSTCLSGFLERFRENVFKAVGTVPGPQEGLRRTQ